MEWTYNKEYVGKAKTAFNIKLNNNKKDIENANGILAYTYFQNQGQN